MLTIDYFSGWWEVDRFYNTTTTAVIRDLKSHFARWGIPSTIVSDNGPQYAADKFHEFTAEWDIEHCTSAPGHANANGKAESGVKAAKHMMEKCKRSHTDPIRGDAGDTQHTYARSRQQPSSAHSKQTHEDHVTDYSDSPGPRGELHQDYDRLKLQHSQAMQAYHYNRGEKDLPVLEEGDSGRMKPFRLGQKT